MTKIALGKGERFARAMPLSKAEISRLRGLSLKRNREESGTFVVEGPKVVAELLTSDYPFISVYATASWTSPGDFIVHQVTDEEMARISHYPTPSPVLAVGPIERPALEPAELAQGFTLALDGIQDPGNVGTLLRIADWFGFDRVLLSPECADPFSPKVVDASRGSFARLRMITTRLDDVLTQGGVPVYGCDLTGEDLWQIEPPARGGIVVIGSEGRGMTPAVAQAVTQRVTIARHGQAESLNAAVAAGIVCAHLRRHH